MNRLVTIRAWLFPPERSSTRASMDAAARRRAGIGDGLVRVSVGIEASEDLVADFELALSLALANDAQRIARFDELRSPSGELAPCIL